MKWLTGSKTSQARKWIRDLGDEAKRERASEAILKLGGDSAPVLIEVLQTEDGNLLQIYKHLLVRLGRAATPALIESLSGDHPAIRGRVADVLGEIKDPDTLPAMLEALAGEFYTVRARAAIALGNIGDKQVIQPIVDSLADPEAEVRIGAVTALGCFSEPSTFDDMADLLLEDPHIQVRQAAAKALGCTQHPRALNYLMVALEDPFWWYERENEANPLLDAIHCMGTLALDSLLKALKTSEGTVRRFAAILLGRLHDERAVEPLGMALYDTHFEVGQAAAASLAGFGPVGLKRLAEAIHHPEPWLRQHAIYGLTLSGDTRILPLILEMVNDPERDVQKQAIQSLGELGDRRALPTLDAIALNRKDKEMHKLAKEAIHALKS